MADDLQRLHRAEQRLLEAVRLCSQTVEKLTEGSAEEAQALSAQLFDAVQESQLTLLELADKYAEPLPIVSEAYAETLAEEAGAAAAAVPANDVFGWAGAG